MCLILFKVGSHWSRQAQADVVAVNWRERAILLGECKWGAEPVGRDVVRELVENKSAGVLQGLADAGEGWQVTCAVFTRAGFIGAARSLAQAHSAWLVDLNRLDRELGEVYAPP